MRIVQQPQVLPEDFSTNSQFVGSLGQPVFGS